MNTLPDFPQRSMLTRRELEVVECVVHELSNKLTARRLNISPRTVEDYRRDALKKLGVKNIAGLMRVVYQLH